MNNKRLTWCGGLILLLLVSGCTNIRSISDAGNDPEHRQFGGAARELDEFDVLGIKRGQPVFEEEIAQAGNHAQRVVMKQGSPVLLIQSGAVYPDGPMITELKKHFEVVPFTGVPEETKMAMGQTVWEPRTATYGTVPGLRYQTAIQSTAGDPGYSKLLRLAAARAGADNIICYWGILESVDEKIPTSMVAWLPVVRWVMPDDREHLRIRVKLAVIDVKSGNWSVFSPEPFEDTAWSTPSRRETVDRKEVEILKARAFQAIAEELARLYMD